MNKTKKIMAVSVIAGVFAACAIAGAMLVTRALADVTPTDGSDSTAQVLDDPSAWTLVSWSDPAPLPDVPITLSIEDGNVSGNSSCNTYFGPVSIGDTSFLVDPLATTMMFCFDTADAETTYLGLFQEASSWRLDGDNLVLSTDGKETLRFEPAS